VSGGDIFRELAAERDLTPLEFNKLAEEDEEIDRELDKRLRDVATQDDDVVLESRLAGWLAGEYADFRIWLDAPLDVRAARIADREDKTEKQAATETRARAGSEAQRYDEYYDIDITDLTIYDLSINTARWNPDDVLAMLTTAVENYESDSDEGKYPITGVSYDF